LGGGIKTARCNFHHNGSLAYGSRVSPRSGQLGRHLRRPTPAAHYISLPPLLPPEGAAGRRAAPRMAVAGPFFRAGHPPGVAVRHARARWMRRRGGGGGRISGVPKTGSGPPLAGSEVCGGGGILLGGCRSRHDGGDCGVRQLRPSVQASGSCAQLRAADFGRAVACPGCRVPWFGRADCEG
jgi:hypothetical protein